MKKAMNLLFAAAVILFASMSAAEAQMIETGWQIGKYTFNALIVIPNEDEAVARIAIYNENDEVVEFVDEKLVPTTYEGHRVFIGKETHIHNGTTRNYTPDNFLFMTSGKAFMFDEEGNKAEMQIRLVKQDELAQIMEKYQIDLPESESDPENISKPDGLIRKKTHNVNININK